MKGLAQVDEGLSASRLAFHAVFRRRSELDVIEVDKAVDDGIDGQTGC